MNDDIPVLSDSVLRMAVERAAADTFYLAHSLDVYQRAHGLSDAQVASELGCSERDIYLINLCRQPDATDMNRFNEDIIAIASRFGISAALLASLVRKAQRTASKHAFSQRQQDPTATMDFVTRAAAYDMAAQDREPDEMEQHSEDDGEDTRL
jgi:hypothetical protein